MNKSWYDKAWEDYLSWQSQDKKTLKRINQLIRDTERSPFNGIGKPEPLKGDLSGFWNISCILLFWNHFLHFHI